MRRNRQDTPRKRAYRRRIMAIATYGGFELAHVQAHVHMQKSQRESW